METTRSFVRTRGFRPSGKTSGRTRTSHERYVREFHEALDQIDAAGFDIAEFRVPQRELNKEWIGTSGRGERHYSSDLYVDRRYLLKMDAVLEYFENALRICTEDHC